VKKVKRGEVGCPVIKQQRKEADQGLYCDRSQWEGHIMTKSERDRRERRKRRGSSE
jgi:hypothetical protein